MRLALRILAALAVTFGAPFARADPSPSLLTTSQVTCTSTLSKIVSAQPGLSNIVTLESAGTVAAYIGPSVQPSGAALSTTNGFLVPAVANTSYTLSISGEIWCVTASGTTVFYVIQQIKGG